MFEQFSDTAVWLLMIFLVINGAVYYFSSSNTFVVQNIGVSGITPDTAFTSDTNATSNNVNFILFTLDCSTASSNALTAAPCFLSQAYGGFTQFTGAFYGFLTGWTHLLDAVLPNWIPGAALIKGILVPIFGLIEFIVIFVVVIQIAGIAAVIFKGIV